MRAKHRWTLEKKGNFVWEEAEGGERERSRGKKGVAPSGLDLIETGL